MHFSNWIPQSLSQDVMRELFKFLRTTMMPVIYLIVVCAFVHACFVARSIYCSIFFYIYEYLINVVTSDVNFNKFYSELS